MRILPLLPERRVQPARSGRVFERRGRVDYLRGVGEWAIGIAGLAIGIITYFVPQILDAIETETLRAARDVTVYGSAVLIGYKVWRIFKS
jgi:hypothetical protein